MRRGRWVTGVLVTVLASGCYEGSNGDPGADGDGDGGTAGDGDGDGDGGDGSDGDPADHMGPFACDPEQSVESLSMRRLSKAQYRNTVEDIFTWATGQSAMPEALAAAVDRIPDDALHSEDGMVRGGFRRLDQAVYQEHIDVGYDVALAAATEMTTQHLVAVAGSCATDGDASNDDGCIDGFIRSFGEHALRRPLTDAEVAFYREVYDADGLTQGTEPEAFADVIVVMLTAPQFVYLVEHGTEEMDDQPGVYRLDAYELAQRLSYQFWQGPPDEELRQAAADGDLLTDEGYEAQVDRLLADPRTDEALREFYGEWLWLEELPPVDARVGTPAYDAFLDGFAVTPETTDNMIGEVLDMTSYYTRNGGTFADLMTSNRSFATTDDVAAIYGVPVWSGGEPPTFNEPERVGLLTRAAMVASGSPNSRPIMKGVRIREALMCEQVPPPPDNAAGEPPELSPDQTNREVIEALTEQPGTQCAGCHATLINPLGYITDHFDGLGRYRTEEVLFAEDGTVTATRPIDAAAEPGVVSDGGVVDQPGTLADMLLDSERVQSCFARNYVRWTFGRPDDPMTDGCMLNSMTVSLTQDEPLLDVLRRLALRDEFKTRAMDF